MFYRALFFLKFLFLVSKAVAFESAVQKLSLEEKIGQLLMVHVSGETAGDEARHYIQNAYVGGVIYYGWCNGLNSPKQVKNLSDGLQNLALENAHPIPLWIAVDQEGGTVSRLRNGFVIFPDAWAFGRCGRLDWVQEAALATAQELRSVGVNINLAPVVDIGPSESSVMGLRTYASDPKLVALYGERVLAGYRQGGILACVKHFPGYGEADTDPHRGIPVLNKERLSLEKTELYPYRQLSAQIEALMTAHILVKDLDPLHPATLSPPILTDLLRQQMGFSGLVFSDSLVMEGVLREEDALENVALEALLAGCDILLLGGKLLDKTEGQNELTPAQIFKLHAFLVEAVKKGDLPLSRVEQSVERTLKLKQKYTQSKAAEFDLLHHQKIALKVSKEALAVEFAKIDLPMSAQPNPVIVITPSRWQKDSIPQPQTDQTFRYMDWAERASLNATIQPKETIVLCWSGGEDPLEFEQQVQVYQQLKCPVFVIVLKNNPPFHLNADVVVRTYNLAPVALTAALEVLFP